LRNMAKAAELPRTRSLSFRGTILVRERSGNARRWGQWIGISYSSLA
jgi:hypothetical protein